MLLHRERPLHSTEIFGIWGIPVSSEIKTSAKSPTRASQDHDSTIRIYRNAIKHLMQSLNQFGRHGIESIRAIQSNHDHSRDWPLEDDDWCW
jgi:hypothetical protein